MLTQLHDAFADFMQQTRSDTLLRPNAPAFFFDEYDVVELIQSAVDTVEASDHNVRLPFPQFWMVFGPSNDMPVAMIIAINETGFEKWRHAVFVKQVNGNWVSAAGRLPREDIQLIMVGGIVAITNREHVERESPARDSINRRRARMSKTVAKIPPFISIVAPNPDAAPVDEIEGVDEVVPGAPRAAHDRRGHWRTYKATGKRVWVKDCAIHGGASEPRNYKV